MTDIVLKIRRWLHSDVINVVMTLALLNLFICHFCDACVVNPTMQSSTSASQTHAFIHESIVTNFFFREARSLGKTVCNFDRWLWRLRTLAGLLDCPADTSGVNDLWRWRRTHAETNQNLPRFDDTTAAAAAAAPTCIGVATSARVRHGG